MYQVIFHIPFLNIPIYGYGLMLFLAFLVTTWLSGWLATKEGIAPAHVQDLAVWIFACGIIGARITYMVQDPRTRARLFTFDFFKIWEGGLVFYGSFLGGVVGYVLAYFFVIRRHGLSTWKLADVIAPSIALGLCLGRLGCFLNGCCFGNVACADCPAIHFPLCSPPRYALTERGLQTAAGFTLRGHSTTVAAVEPGSPAERHGLRAGDTIVGADGQDIQNGQDLDALLVGAWPRGKRDLALTVVHAGEPGPVALAPFSPKTLGLHPTQLYESVSTFLLMLVLLAYYPFRRRAGELMVLFLLCYPVHRFVNEMLRNDTDPVAFGMTLSQNGSILFFVVGVVLLFWVRRQPVQYFPAKS